LFNAQLNCLTPNGFQPALIKHCPIQLHFCPDPIAFLSLSLNTVRSNCIFGPIQLHFCPYPHLIVFGVCDKQDIRAPVVFRLRWYKTGWPPVVVHVPVQLQVFSLIPAQFWIFMYKLASCNRQYRSKFTTACSVYLRKKLYLKAGYEDKWLFPCPTDTCYCCRKSLMKTDFCENK
jgi:hypothetical protein